MMYQEPDTYTTINNFQVHKEIWPDLNNLWSRAENHEARHGVAWSNSYLVCDLSDKV